jgi:hypothetical protein
MAKSILQQDSLCFLCGKNGGYWGLDVHHVYFGALRSKSDKYGLTVLLCHDTCHLNGVHKNAEVNRNLQSFAQNKAMAHYGWTEDDFRKIFHKSYI